MAQKQINELAADVESQARLLAAWMLKQHQGGQDMLHTTATNYGHFMDPQVLKSAPLRSKVARFGAGARVVDVPQLGKRLLLVRRAPRRSGSRKMVEVRRRRRRRVARAARTTAPAGAVEAAERPGGSP